MIWVTVIDAIDVLHAVLVLLHKNVAPELVESFPDKVTILKILPVAVRKLAGIRVTGILEATYKLSH